MQDRLLTIEYGAIQGTYWMLYAPLSSFASAFLLSRGYSNSEIGLLIAVGNILAVFLQPLIADLADRSRRLTLANISEIMTVIMMVLTVGQLVIKHRSMALFVVYVLLLAFLACILPLFNTLNFELQKCGVELNFGLCRSGGSFAFATVCAFIGTLVEKFGVDVLPISNEIILVLIMISLIAVMKRYRTLLNRNIEAGIVSQPAENRRISREDDITLLEFIRHNRMFLVLNIGVFVMYTHNQILNGFMYQILQPIGGNSEDMGRIFALMAYLEIPVMIIFDRLNRRWNCQKLIVVSTIAFTMKITVILFARSVALVYAAMLLQTLSYGLFQPGIVKFIAHVMAPGEQAKGQALCTMMMSVSAIVGSLVGGWILDLSGPKMLLIFGVFMAAAGTVIIAMTINRIPRKR